MKLIKNGQIIIGPWYNMPDEFLLSGESLIKNLRLGLKKSREEYGVEPAKNAYICDIFGHVCRDFPLQKASARRFLREWGFTIPFSAEE